MRTSPLVGATILLTAILAVGCTGTTDPGASSPVTPSPTITEGDGSTTAPKPGDELEFFLGARFNDGSCSWARLGGITDEHSLADHPRRVGTSLIVVPDDGGPTIFASGSVRVDDAGVPVAYVVAKGDTPFAVAARFCMSRDQLSLLNMVRRTTSFSSWVDGDPPDPGTWQEWIELFAGDTINLDPATITSVGDQNGRVYAHDPGFYLPPQK